jgi:hypothetical protein
MRKLFISIAFFAAAIVFFLFEAPSLPAPKTEDNKVSPVKQEPKKAPLDTLSEKKGTDTALVKI